MTEDEQKTICKEMAKACMWGQGGIASVILDKLDKALPMRASWKGVYRDNQRDAVREHMGVLDDEDELLRYMSRGYWLCNGDSLFNPPPMNGLCMYVSDRLYQKYKPRY